VQQPELLEGLADLTTLTGARGAAEIVDALQHVQEMLTLVKKRESQDLAGSEREQKKLPKRRDFSQRPIVRAHLFCRQKNVCLFFKRGLGFLGGPLF
jgi:hypothetical protein